LTGARHVGDKNADALIKIEAIANSPFLFAAVEGGDKIHQRRRTRIVRQPEISDNFFALKRNADYFEARLKITRIMQKRIDALLVRLFLLRRIIGWIVGKTPSMKTPSTRRESKTEPAMLDLAKPLRRNSPNYKRGEKTGPKKGCETKGQEN